MQALRWTGDKTKYKTDRALGLGGDCCIDNLRRKFYNVVECIGTIKFQIVFATPVGSCWWGGEGGGWYVGC